MAKFHIREDGNPGVCSASEGGCPFGANVPHYATKDEARRAYEQLVKDEAVMISHVDGTLSHLPKVAVNTASAKIGDTRMMGGVKRELVAKHRSVHAQTGLPMTVEDWKNVKTGEIHHKSVKDKIYDASGRRQLVSEKTYEVTKDVGEVTKVQRRWKRLDSGRIEMETHSQGDPSYGGDSRTLDVVLKDVVDAPVKVRHFQFGQGSSDANWTETLNSASVALDRDLERQPAVVAKVDNRTADEIEEAIADEKVRADAFRDEVLIPASMNAANLAEKMIEAGYQDSIFRGYGPNRDRGYIFTELTVVEPGLLKRKTKRPAVGLVSAKTSIVTGRLLASNDIIFINNPSETNGVWDAASQKKQILCTSAIDNSYRNKMKAQPELVAAFAQDYADILRVVERMERDRRSDFESAAKFV